MKTVKQYAAEKSVSTQAVYQMMETHKTELQPFIMKQGRTRFLMPEAEEILENYRNKAAIIIEKAESTDRIKELEQLVSNLQTKITEQADKIASLSEWKADKAVALAEVESTKLLLESARATVEEQTRRAIEAESQVAAAEEKAAQEQATREQVELQAEEALKKLKCEQELKERTEQEAENIRQQLQQEKQTSDVLRQEIQEKEIELQTEQERKLTWRERLTGKKQQPKEGEINV